MFQRAQMFAFTRADHLEQSLAKEGSVSTWNVICSPACNTYWGECLSASEREQRYHLHQLVYVWRLLQHVPSTKKLYMFKWNSSDLWNHFTNTRCVRRTHHEQRMKQSIALTLCITFLPWSINKYCQFIFLLFAFSKQTLLWLMWIVNGQTDARSNTNPFFPPSN